MGASALALTACSEAQVDAGVYTSLDDCLSDVAMTKAQCEGAFKTARREHAEVAPKYQSKTDCEADFGSEKCEKAPYQTSSGSSVFMPLMVGYMLGRTMGAGGVHPQPLYRSKDDPKNFRTADHKKVGAKTGLTKVPKSSTARPGRKLFTVARGGFGAGGRSYGYRGG